MINYFMKSTGILSRRLCGTKFFLNTSLFILAISAASCTRDTDVGLDVVPANDLIDLRVTDTTTLITSTLREDSLRSDEPGAALLGTINDVTFGRSTAGIFTQVRIANNQLNLNFGTLSDLVLDSTVLTLPFKPEYYGDTLQTQTISVYQMTEDIVKTKNYYSNRPKQYYPTAIGTKTFSPRPNTKVILGNDTFAPHIRVTIDPNFAQQIFSQSGTQNLNGNDNFLNYMKGFYIAPDSTGFAPGTGVLSTIGLLDSMSRLTFYYHTISTSVADDYSFVIGTDAANYSYFTHNYSAAPINGLIGQSGSHSEVYVQGMSGLKTKIEIPFLQQWKDKWPIAINKAELVIKADPASIVTGLPANDRLFLTAPDSTGGNESILIDMAALSTYGGTQDYTTHEYRINLTRYFQSLVDNQESFHGLYLKDFTPVASPRRAVIGGDASSQYKMYLRLTYTKIN